MNHRQTAPDNINVTRALLGSLALVLAIAGQFILYVNSDGLLWGLMLDAMALLIFAQASFRQPPAWSVALVSRLSLSFSALLILLATMLSIVADVMSLTFDKFGVSNHMPVLALWTGAAICYLLAFSLNLRWPSDWRARVWAHRQELALLTLAFGIGVAIRFYRLGEIPRVINGDEGVVGQAAVFSIRHPNSNPFSLSANFGALYLQGIKAAIDLFGHTPFALRLLPALGGSLAILSIYLLGRLLFGPRVGFVAALLLAVSHVHIHFSRTAAVGYIQGTFLGPLELYFFYSGLRQRSALRMAIGGVILGLHLNVYISAQVIAAILLLYLLGLLVVDRSLVQNAIRPILAFWYGLLVMALPNLTYAALNTNLFFERLNADGTFQSGWLEREIAQTGQPALQILAGRAAHAFLSLIYYPALDFYGMTAPVLNVLTGAFFVLGLAYVLWLIRRPEYLLIGIYFWGATLAIGIFSVPPSADSYRMLIAFPAVILVAALGMRQTLTILSPVGNGQGLFRMATSAVVLISVAAINLRMYFVDFAGKCVYGNDTQTRFASYLGSYLQTVDRNTVVYLLGNDVVQYGTHPSVDFLSNNLYVNNLLEPIGALEAVPNMAIVALPIRGEELKSWISLHPGGELTVYNDCQTQIMMAYRLP